MADLTGQNIQDTYQRIIQIDNGSLQDGVGNIILDSDELETLQTIGSANITSTEWLEIAKIGSADISADEWGYVASMQDVSTTSTPSFESLKLSSLSSTQGIPVISLPINATSTLPHLQVFRIGVDSPSIFLGDNNEDIISFVNQASSTVATIDQSGGYNGTVDGGTW